MVLIFRNLKKINSLNSLIEPTNHLDVANVMWLQNYLNSLEFCTCLVISHDTKFLDSVCDNIIHYESKKLKVK